MGRVETFCCCWNRQLARAFGEHGLSDSGSDTADSTIRAAERYEER